MFFDVTRYGGRRTLRVRAEAIAWLDEAEGTTVIHLIGGETIRVNEGRDDVEMWASGAPKNAIIVRPPALNKGLLEPEAPVDIPPAVPASAPPLVHRDMDRRNRRHGKAA